MPAAAKLRILELGDDTAAGLGLNVRGTRLGLILLGVGLTAVATAVTGPLAFVAFLAGPLALRLCGGRSHLGSAALIGALLVTAATFIAANILHDTTIASRRRHRRTGSTIPDLGLGAHQQGRNLRVAMALLQAQDLTLAYDSVSIVDELSLQLPAGEVTIIVGANGCGKSTLLRGLSGC